MFQDWKELTELTRGKPITVERVKLRESSIAIEGHFELPPLAQISMEDQVFVAAFVKTHGSIKEMEKLFGVSYPTVKGRLNRISEALGFGVPSGAPSSESRMEILARLERGEISAEDAANELKKI
ncbi:MAG: DUF2089 domain-containing protein [Bdellovibrionales bacterium]|nr:DUF2089 domain-containing protein [Bdellovibrionales bacterium]